MYKSSINYTHMEWYMRCSTYNDLSIAVKLREGLFAYIQYSNRFPSFLWYDPTSSLFYSNVEPITSITTNTINDDLDPLPLFKRIGGYMNNGDGILFINFDLFIHVEQATTRKVLMRQPYTLSDTTFVGFIDDCIGVITWVAH